MNRLQLFGAYGDVGVGVTYLVPLVQHRVSPSNGEEIVTHDTQMFVRGQDLLRNPKNLNLGVFLLRAEARRRTPMKYGGTQPWRPGAKLASPLPQHSRGAHHQGWLIQPRAFQGAQKSGDLDGFTQTHLVADDASGSLAV